MNKRSYSIRRLLCYFLSIALSFTLLGSNMLLVSSLTVGNRNFVQKYFSAAGVTNELSQELDKRLEEIADNYGFELNLATAFSQRISTFEELLTGVYRPL